MSTGIYVIDEKRFRGRPSLLVEGGITRPRVEKLMVAGRARSKLVDGVLHQVDLVRGIVGDNVPDRGVLYRVEAGWLIRGSFVTRDLDVLRPKKLYGQLQNPGRWPRATSRGSTSCSRVGCVRFDGDRVPRPGITGLYLTPERLR